MNPYIKIPQGINFTRYKLKEIIFTNLITWVFFFIVNCPPKTVQNMVNIVSCPNRGMGGVTLTSSPT